MHRLLPLSAGVILAAACYTTGVPLPRGAMDCVTRAANDQGYLPAYTGERPNTLLLRKRSGDDADDLFATVTMDSTGVSHVAVTPSSLHFADVTDPTDHPLPTSPDARRAAAYVKESCDGVRS